MWQVAGREAEDVCHDQSAHLLILFHRFPACFASEEDWLIVFFSLVMFGKEGFLAKEGEWLLECGDFVGAALCFSDALQASSGLRGDERCALLLRRAAALGGGGAEQWQRALADCTAVERAPGVLAQHATEARLRAASIFRTAAQPAQESACLQRALRSATDQVLLAKIKARLQVFTCPWVFCCFHPFFEGVEICNNNNNNNSVTAQLFGCSSRLIFRCTSSVASRLGRN